jgi:molecular chaperone Hsp33
MNDNFVQSFQLESSNIRGRVVRLGSVLDDILNAHKAYPEDVLHLTGEILTLCVMLSSMLKYDGIFTLQVQGDGPVSMLVADVVDGGKIRACATYKQERLAAESHKGNRAHLIGDGHMAFTVDQGKNMERYQGIVELKPESLIASVQHYFTQSEQIGTGIVMSVGRTEGKWRASGIMLQQMRTATFMKTTGGGLWSCSAASRIRKCSIRI